MGQYVCVTVLVRAHVRLAMLRLCVPVCACVTACLYNSSLCYAAPSVLTTLPCCGAVSGQVAGRQRWSALRAAWVGAVVARNHGAM